MIKSLAVSVVMYACEMKEMPDKYVQMLNNVMFDFLWDGRKQIRREICMLPRHMGGIGMVDVNIMMKVKHVKWIIRILEKGDNEKWNIIPRQAMKSLDGRFGIDNFLIKVNDSREILNKAVNVPEFYKVCINSYQEMCRKSRISEDNEILWCNNIFKFNGKPLALAHWSISGIQRVSDILENGILREEHIFSKLIHKAGYIFEIQKVRAGLPIKWKTVKSENECKDESDTQNNFECNSILKTKFNVPGKGIKTLEELTSKDLYSIFLLNKWVEIKSKEYWKRKFPDESIDFYLWFKYNFVCYIIPRKCCDFNWKVFHGHVFTEMKLQKMKLSNGMCTLCESRSENLEHLLIECEGVSDIWDMVNNIALEISENNVNSLNRFNFLAGFFVENKFTDIVNMILSITRFMIWKRRNSNKYEDKLIEITECKKLIVLEIRNHIEVLLNVANVKKENEMMTQLEHVLNVIVRLEY